IVRIGVADTKSKSTTWLKWDGTAEHYYGRVQWSTTDGAIFLQTLSRDQKKLALVRADPATGATKELVTASSPTWIEFSMMEQLEKSERFLWTAELGGHIHLQLRDKKTGAVIAQLTKGDFDVMEIHGCDEDKGLAYFSSTFDGPLGSALYSVPLQGG